MQLLSVRPAGVRVARVEDVAALEGRVRALEARAGKRPEKDEKREKLSAKEKRESQWMMSMFRNHRVPLQNVVVPPAVREAGKRGRVLAELLESEARFVNDMAVLRGVFQAALMEQARRTKPIISEDEVRAFFPAILPELCTLHESFLSRLKECMANWDAHESVVGPLLSEQAQSVREPHADYAIAFANASLIAQEWAKTRPAVASFLRDCRTHSQCANRDVVDFLIMPIQRLLRYRLLALELLGATPDAHPDHGPLSEAVEELERAGHAVNASKCFSEHRQDVEKLFEERLAGGERFEYLKTLLLHPDEKTDRQVIFEKKVMKHDHSGGSEKLRLVLLSDVLLVCVKKFRAEKLTITDYLWLADAAPVSLFPFRGEDCLLIESRSELQNVAKDIRLRSPRPARSDFALLITLIEPNNSSDDMERLRATLNSAVAFATGTRPPSLPGLQEPSTPAQAQPSTPVMQSVKRLSRASRRSASEAVAPDPVPVPTPTPNATANASNVSEEPAVSAAAVTAVSSASSSSLASSAGGNVAGSRTTVLSPSHPRKTDSANRGLRAVMGRTFRKKDAKNANRAFGVSLMLQWELASGAPPILADCCAELGSRGTQVEGIFRVPGSVDAVSRLRKAYDVGDSVDLHSADVYAVASLLTSWLRELPEGLIPEMAAEALLDVSDVDLHASLEAALSGPALQVLGELLLVSHAIAVVNTDETKMTPENIAVCLTPDVVRASGAAGNSDPMASLKLSAKYGRLVRRLVEAAPTLFSRGPASVAVSPTQSAAADSRKKRKDKKAASKKATPTPLVDANSNLGTVTALAAHAAESKDELGFAEGDSITIHQIDPNGLWWGSRDGNIGWFPASKTNAGGVVQARRINLSLLKNVKPTSPIASPRESVETKASSPRSNNAGSPRANNNSGSPRANNNAGSPRSGGHGSPSIAVSTPTEERPSPPTKPVKPPALFEEGE